MRLTTFTDYGLRVLIHVASAPDGRATIAQVASAYGISENHVVKVAHRLGQVGALVNTRGRGGGLRLASDAAQMKLGPIVRLLERTDGLAECFENDKAGCVIAHDCGLRHVLVEAAGAFYETLDRYTLADLVRRREPLVVALHARKAA